MTTDTSLSGLLTDLRYLTYLKTHRKFFSILENRPIS